MKLLEEKFSWLTELERVCVLRENLNYIKIPVNKFELNSDYVNKFNSLVEFLKKNNAKKIVRTKSGGICIDRSKFSYFSYDLRACGSGFELTLITDYQYRIQLGHCNIDEDGIDNNVSGTQALRRFEKELKNDGINLKDYTIENGEEINRQIKKPLIKSYVANSDINKVKWFENVHHLDFHKAYMSGLYKSHPEMRTTIERLYNLRHTDKTIKAVFTNTIGKMHSKQIKWKYANLSKDAINTFYEMFNETVSKMIRSGCRILAYNTDGIWYQGDIYEDENCGDNLTQYSNDYTNCKIRWKSDGAYEFYYQDRLYTKLRGRTRLDRIKNRDKDGLGWDEGDIFDASATVIKYMIKGDIIIEIEE